MPSRKYEEIELVRRLLNQTRTSTSWVMSDPSSFLPIKVLLGIEGICSQSCISLAFPALFCPLPTSLPGEMFVVCDEYDPAEQTTQSDVIQNWSVSATRARSGTLTCFTRASESLTWRCLPTVLKPAESMVVVADLQQTRDR